MATAPIPASRSPTTSWSAATGGTRTPAPPLTTPSSTCPAAGRHSFGGDSEALWTETAAYPSFAVVEYNTDPVIAYAGSAIFIHADTGTPTTGCMSIPLPELDQLLRWINPADTPTVVLGPASEIRSF